MHLSLHTARTSQPRCSGHTLHGIRFLAVLVSLCLLTIQSFAASGTGTATQTFLWEQANAQASSAVTPDDYLNAAKTYNRLVSDGVRNGPLFLNLGSALVMAGDGANAAAAFERAERYLGATPDTRQGLLAALALQSGRSRNELPWSRTAFFWHYAMPAPVRALMALGGGCLFWLGVFFRILYRRRRTLTLLHSLDETCMLSGGLVAAVFTASFLMTLIQERHDIATWEARVFQASTPSELEAAP